MTAAMRCVVVGGAGAVGAMFTDLLRGSGAEVCVVDTVPPAGDDPGYRPGDITAPDPAVAAELSHADLVVLAVPERVALAAAGPVARALAPGAVLADTVSVKGRIVPALRALDVPAVSLNPLFGPALGPSGRAVAAVVVREGPGVAELLRLVQSWGTRIVRLGAEEHDRLTGVTQGLTHATVLAFGLALDEMGADLATSGDAAPPPYETLLALLARIAGGNPAVYHEIHAGNPEAARAREALAGGVRRLAELVDGGEQDFAAGLAGLRDRFGPRLGSYQARCAQLFAGAERKPANWVRSRIDRTSDSLDRAFREGLTGHVITGRKAKRVQLDDGTDAVEFVSCSYLGLEEHPALTGAAADALQRFGAHFSTSRNRLRPMYLGELEGLLSEMYRGARVVPFTSVGTVHLGLLPLLGAGALPSYPIADGGVTFLVERTAHASMQVIRGVLDQLGPVHRFDLADPGDLQARLVAARAARRTPVVLVDGVGSMGGLIDVVSLREQILPYGGHLYVDDAHGTSIAGRWGAGYAFDVFGDRLPSNVVIAGSLSKAFGGAGGFAVVPGEEDVRVLRKFANPLVFGHSIMLPMLAADVAAARLHLSGEVAGLQRRLWANARRFDELTSGRLVNAGLRSPVRGALFGTEEEAFAAATRLRRADVLILPAFFPTVAQGTGLIRFALSALHEPEQLETAAKALGPVEGIR